jgi:hypothetical protein
VAGSRQSFLLTVIEVELSHQGFGESVAPEGDDELAGAEVKIRLGKADFSAASDHIEGAGARALDVAGEEEGFRD